MMKLTYAILFSAALNLISIFPSFSMENIEENHISLQKQPPLVNHTFNVGDENITVALPYKYKKVDPTIRFFFEGEVILIDPETSPFEFYVTYPLCPCVFGLINDPMSGKSLVFHKYAFHNMDSLQPYYKKLEISDSAQLKVSLYSYAMSESEFEERQEECYEGKTQFEEMQAVHNFLRDSFKIPGDNIEMCYFDNNELLQSFRLLNEYSDTPKVIGVTKMGELFHTSVIAEDIFGLENVKLPGSVRHFKKFSALDYFYKSPLMSNFYNTIRPIVQKFFEGNLELRHDYKYGELNFISCDKLNIPASSLPQMFQFRFGTSSTVAPEYLDYFLSRYGEAPKARARAIDPFK